MTCAFGHGAGGMRFQDASARLTCNVLGVVNFIASAFNSHSAQRKREAKQHSGE